MPPYPSGLPLDSLSRHGLVAAALERVWANLAPGPVLDVGAPTASLAAFLPEWRVVACDPQFSGTQDEGQVADGRSLPYPEGAFPVVTSLDALEHIPAADRPAFLAELSRVASQGVALTFPFQAAEVVQIESMISQLRSSEAVRGFLAEHEANGLPDLTAVETTLRELGWSHLQVCLGTPRTPLLASHFWEEVCSLVPGGEELVPLLNEWIAPWISLAAPSGSAYRVLLLASKSPLPNFAEILGFPGEVKRQDVTAAQAETAVRLLEQARTVQAAATENQRSTTIALAEQVSRAEALAEHITRCENEISLRDAALKHTEDELAAKTAALTEAGSYCRSLENRVAELDNRLAELEALLAEMKAHPLKFLARKGLERLKSSS